MGHEEVEVDAEDAADETAEELLGMAMLRHLPNLPPILSHCHCNFLWYIRLTSTRDLSRQTRDFYPKNLLGLQLWSCF